MKNLYEHMVTAMVMVLLMFAFTSIMVGEMQVVNARRLFTSAVNTILSSYYTANVDSMNDKIHEVFGDTWNLSVEGYDTVETRKDVKVKLTYTVTVPIFGIVKDGTIEGYAR